MRKLLWLGLALFAGVCGTSYYAMMHPGSMVGQCVFKAGEFGLRVNPIVVLARGIANARHQEPVSTAPVEDVVPDEPAALDEPAAKPLAGMIDLDPALQAPSSAFTRTRSRQLPATRSSANPLTTPPTSLKGPPFASWPRPRRRPPARASCLMPTTTWPSHRCPTRARPRAAIHMIQHCWNRLRPK